MTNLRVTLDDRTLIGIQNRADHSRKTLEEAASQLLQVANFHLPIGGRVVVLSGEPLEKIEAILGGGSVLNHGDLCQKVERLAGISFLHCRLPFTPNQLEHLKDRAERQGLTVQQLVDRTAPRIYEQFFNLLERV